MLNQKENGAMCVHEGTCCTYMDKSFKFSLFDFVLVKLLSCWIVVAVLCIDLHSVDDLK